VCRECETLRERGFKEQLRHFDFSHVPTVLSIGRRGARVEKHARSTSAERLCASSPLYTFVKVTRFKSSAPSSSELEDFFKKRIITFRDLALTNRLSTLRSLNAKLRKSRLRTRSASHVNRCEAIR